MAIWQIKGTSSPVPNISVAHKITKNNVTIQKTPHLSHQKPQFYVACKGKKIKPKIPNLKKRYFGFKMYLMKYYFTFQAYRDAFSLLFQPIFRSAIFRFLHGRQKEECRERVGRYNHKVLCTADIPKVR